MKPCVTKCHHQPNMTRQNEEITGTMEQAPSVASNRGFNSLSSHHLKPAQCHSNVTNETAIAEMLRALLEDGDTPKCIRVGRNYVAIVDVADYPRVIGHNWQPIHSGANVYAQNGDGELLHRFILGANKSTQVDHRNHQTLDCRRDNLRFSTQTENRANSRKLKPAKSQYKGVTRNKSGSWIARVTKTENGKKTSYHLGSFVNELDAAAAYDLRAFQLFGEFAKLNFPDRRAA